MYHRLRYQFERTRWYHLLTRLKWKLISIHLEIVLILMHDRCTVCVECTIGSEIILDAHDGTTSNEPQVEAHFGPFEDSANFDAR